MIYKRRTRSAFGCQLTVIEGSSRVGRSPFGFQGAVQESRMSGIYVGTSVVAGEGLGIQVGNLQGRFLPHLFSSSILSIRLVLLVRVGLRLPSSPIVQQDPFKRWNFWQHPCLLTLNCTSQGNCWRFFLQDFEGCNTLVF